MTNDLAKVCVTITDNPTRLVTITGINGRARKIIKWMKANTSSGEFEFKKGKSRVIDFNEAGRVGFEVSFEPDSIVWRYGSDDDVCLLRMRWEGAE